MIRDHTGFLVYLNSSLVATDSDHFAGELILAYFDLWRESRSQAKVNNKERSIRSRPGTRAELLDNLNIPVHT